MFLFHLFLYTAEIQAADADGDGVDESVDCDDTNNMIYPNAMNDQMDNNCDGVIDEGTDRTFWRDADGDDYGKCGEFQKDVANQLVMWLIHKIVMIATPPSSTNEFAIQLTTLQQ